MRLFWICFLLVSAQIHAQESEGLSEKVETAGDEFPSELTTKNGQTYLHCKLKRVETDALIVEHQGGIARISFFDLDERFQKEHGFDPIAAMEKYRNDQKMNRELKWQRFWEAEQYRASVAEREEHEKYLETARATWIPVEARIVQPAKEGGFVEASRITFVPTKAKSALGFEIDGPPRKTLVRMTPKVIFIEATGIKSGIWKGYLEPYARGTILRKGDEIPRYRAVARTDIK